MDRYAWVTLATNDAYSLGALVLAHSLRRVGTKYDLVCMVTPGVTTTMREKLAAVFSLVQEVNVLDSKDEANLALLARPELGITFTKLHCWRLTQYAKCVFVDADALVVRNCDELFKHEELSAAPDVGWPDCFNSGVFVYKPSQQTFASIISFAATKGSFDGGDQGLLNMYFSDWATKDISKHLPFIYNMCSTATYSYLPAFKQFGEDVRIIHFIGITKPWLQYFDTLTGVVQPPAGSEHLQPLLQLWWNLFCERVHPQLTTSMVATRISGLLLPDISPKPYIPVPRPYIPAPAPFMPFDVNHDAYNDVSQQAPDFSEFKDPWEDHSYYNTLHESLNERVAFTNEHENDSHEADQSSSQTSSRSCWKEESVSCQTDHITNERQFELERNQHDYTIHNEYYQYVTPHSEDNYSQHSTQHTTHHHWQPSEHEQQQHNVQRHHHEQYHDEERQSGEQHQHSGQFQQENYHKTNDETAHYSTQHQQIHEHYYAHEWQSHPVEVKYENHVQHRASDNNQASHQNVNYHQFNAQRISESIQSASNERSLEAGDKHTNEPRIDSHPLPPAPNSELHNIATQTDPSAANHAGIAGALAQLTLGAARSEQQIVLEEQMRKQSWEQGHIDYMGQDSFDNIWKKICETLSQAQQRQASPPKEDKPKDEGSSAPVAPAVPAAAIPAAIVEQKTPAAETDKDSTQEQSLICKLPEEKLPAPAIPAETRVENVIVAQPSEQKTPALAAEESVTVEAAATKPIQSAPEDAFVKPPTQESQDVKPCETCTEVPSPKPPVELPPPAETTAEQCKLVSPAMQEAASQDKSESVQLPAEATPPAESQACLLTSAVCKPLLPEAAAPVVQTEIAPAPADDKPQVPAPAAPATPETIQPAAIPETIQPAATPETIQLAATPETIQPVATPETTQPTATPIDAGTPQDTTASAVAPSETSIPEIGKPITECTTDVTQPLTIDPSERHAEMLLAASEISTVSPVPIQVAESVLQAEPKESVSDTAATVSDQVIATTVTAVTDVAPTIAAEPKEQAVQLNGLACDSGKRDDVAVAAPSPPEKTDAAAEPTKEASDSITVKDVPAEVQPAVKEKVEPISSVVAADIPTGKVEEEATKPAEQVPVTTGTTEAASTAQITTPEAKEAKSAEQQVTKTEATEAKPAEQIAKVKPAEEKPKEASEQPAKIEITKAIAQPEVKVAKSEIAEAKPTESTEQAIKAEVLAEAATAKPPGEVPKLPVAETPQQPPAEPVEAKALDIPSTPTVTEATPPTSPSVESAQETAEGQEKAAKKSLKKSDSADGADGESADKKAKKTVKKVTKKPKSQKSEEAAPAAPEAAPAATPFTVAATVTAAAVTTATVAATAAATATGDNSQSKAKKTVKVVKKTGAKSGGQSLEADTTVPETPPPPTTTAAATPDAPVPPKRKTKTSPPSAKGMTGKKSEAEE